MISAAFAAAVAAAGGQSTPETNPSIGCESIKLVLSIKK